MQKRILQVLASSLLTALLLYAVFSELSIGEFVKTLTLVDRNLLLTYLALSLFGVVCRAERYRFVLRDTAKLKTAPSRYSMLIITVIRNGLVDFLPARLGETSFLYVCSRYGFPLLCALSAFGVCLVLDILVLFGLLLAFFLFQFVFATDSFAFAVSPMAIGVLTGVTLLLGLLLYQLDRIIDRCIALAKFLFAGRLPGKLETGFTHVLAWGATVSDELRQVKLRGTYPQLVLLTTGLRAAKYLSLYVLLLAVVAQFGITPSQISPLLSTTAFIGAEASASLPVSGIMGFGAYEAAWSAIFSMSSVKIPSIAAVILAVHIITQVVGYSLALLGLFAFLIDEFRSRRGDLASNTSRELEELDVEESSPRVAMRSR